jgi:hypothetical protein
MINTPNAQGKSPESITLISMGLPEIMEWENDLFDFETVGNCF